MKKKGFATSAILYTLLLLFLALMVGILNNLQNKKTILDTMKQETVSALQLNTVVEELLKKVNNIEQLLGGTDISQIADGTITGTIAQFYQGGAGGTDGGNIRYNAETDCIEIYDSENQAWVCWTKVGLKGLDLLSTSPSDWEIKNTAGNSGKNANGSILTENGTFQFTNTGKSDGAFSEFKYNKSQAIRNGMKLYFEGYLFWGTPYANVTNKTYGVYVDISDNDGTTWTQLYQFYTGSSNFNTEIDLSGYAGKEVYFRIRLRGYGAENITATMEKFMVA